MPLGAIFYKTTKVWKQKKKKRQMGLYQTMKLVPSRGKYQREEAAQGTEKTISKSYI
jgi:hypothetical protein